MVYKDKWYKIAETYAFPTKGSISLLLGDSSVIFYANSDFSSSVISLVNHSVVPEVTIEIRMQNEGAKRTVEFRFLSATFNEGLIAEISIITGANWIETVPTESVTTNVIALLGEVIGTGGSGAFDPNQFFYFDEETGTVVSRYNIASEKGVSAYGIGTVGSGGGGYSPISVIDDLHQNTVDLTKALSARQGYILSGKIGEKQDIIPANTYSPFLHTHDNYAGKAAFEVHITNTDIHLSEPQKQALASFMEMFEMDVVNDSIKAKKTIYSVAGVSAYGLGFAGGGGGGADVYNGLDSDSPVMALSALQGKVLKGLIDTHNHSGVYATPSYVDQQISALVASSPETLNTLNELAAALGNDPNFATTITNQIGTKEPGLGNPASDGMILSSSAGGIRSWVNRYVLPIATAAILGGVMIGTGLSATAQGVLSHSDFSIESGIGGSLGHVKASEKTAWNNHIADNSAHMSVDERNFFNKLKTYFVFAADNSSVHTTINFFSQYGVSAYGLGVAGGGGSLVNVIDNLSSTSITEALSANMGRYLNTLISGKSDTGHSHTWESITGKPVTFAPAAHTHDLYALASSLSSYSLTSHNHTYFYNGNSFGGDCNALAEDYKLNYTHLITSSATNLFPIINNANAIISIATHPGGYNHQLGFSSNGNIYSRQFSAGTAYAWKRLIYSDNPTFEGVVTAPSFVAHGAFKMGTSGYIRGGTYELLFNSAADSNMMHHDASNLYVYGNIYVGGNGWNSGNAVLHAGNYSSYALPLSGGTLTSSNALVLALNSTSALETYIALRRNGTTMGGIGYYDPFGTYMQGGSKILYVNNTASYFYNGSTSYELIHSGNIGSQSVNYATSAGNADTLDNQHASYFATAAQLNASNLASGYLPYWNGSSLVNSQVTSNGTSVGFSGTAYDSPKLLILTHTEPSVYSGYIGLRQEGLAYAHISIGTRSAGVDYMGTLNVGNGNVGVGYFGRPEKLAVYGNGYFADSLNATAIGTAYYGLQVTGSAGGARHIFLAGQYGVTNGFTIRFDGTTMKYNFASGGVGIGMDDNGYALAVNGTGYFANTLSMQLLSISGVEAYHEIQSFNKPLHINRQGNNTYLNVAGNVCIGGTEVYEKLGVVRSGNGNIARFSNTDLRGLLIGLTDGHATISGTSSGQDVYLISNQNLLFNSLGATFNSYLKATSIKIGDNWEAIPNGTTLELKFNGITKARINSNGDLVAYGGLSAYGIPQV